MPSRRSVTQWSILFGVISFLGAALLIGSVATVVIGMQNWSGPPTSQAFYSVEVVQTPQGFRLVREYRDALNVKDGVILARVGYELIQSDHPSRRPIHRHWELKINYVAFQETTIAGPGMNESEIGFYRAALAEGILAANPLSPFTPATIEQARTTDTFDETIWTNAAIYAWSMLMRSPWYYGPFIAICATIAYRTDRRVMRSLRRAVRGCCRLCGYDLSGITPGLCPECGHPSGNRTAQTSAQATMTTSP